MNLEKAVHVKKAFNDFIDSLVDAHENDMLTDTEAGILLGGTKSPLHKDTLAKWRHLKTGPKFVKFGESKTSVIRYKRKDLEDFIEEMSKPPKNT